MKTTTKTTTKKRLDIEKKVLNIIEENNGITMKQISVAIGISEDGVRYHIKKMKKAGLLEYVGSSKSGHWEIK